MNRKLQHTFQALTTTAAVFGLLLLAGGPPGPSLPDSAVLMVSAEAAAEAPVAAAETVEAAEVPAGQVRRNHRAALAMPYFSFAQGGLRRVTGS
jgi:hypothetical protein